LQNIGLIFNNEFLIITFINTFQLKVVNKWKE